MRHNFVQATPIDELRQVLKEMAQSDRRTVMDRALIAHAMNITRLIEADLKSASAQQKLSQPQ